MGNPRRPWYTVSWPARRWYSCRATALAIPFRRTASTTAPISGRSGRPGVARVIAVNAVGGIASGYLDSERLVFPDQIIDYTYDRKHTFFGNDLQQVTHVDFTEPYCGLLRKLLIEAAKLAKLPHVDHGTYGATQGPRFESAAEIQRMERDGADIVGMTGMPEAGLARELELCYASVAVVVNPAAGKATGPISLKEIEKNLETGMARVRLLLERAIALIAQA